MSTLTYSQLKGRLNNLHKLTDSLRSQSAVSTHSAAVAQQQSNHLYQSLIQELVQREDWQLDTFGRDRLGQLLQCVKVRWDIEQRLTPPAVAEQPLHNLPQHLAGMLHVVQTSRAVWLARWRRIHQIIRLHCATGEQLLLLNGRLKVEHYL